MKTKHLALRYYYFVAAFSFLCLSSCAVEVGNPHQEGDRDKKALIDISVISEGSFDFDRINLNITGFSLLSANNPDSAVTFSLQSGFSLDRSDANQVKSVLTRSTTAHGTYDTIRVNFSRNGIGDIITSTRTIPIVMPTEISFLDIPLQFVLSPGRKTNITLGFDHTKLLQESLDEQGQVVSYTFGSDFGTVVEQEALLEETAFNDVSTDLTLARAYRLTVTEVNAGRQVFVRYLRLKIGNEWERNRFTGPNGSIGVNAVVVTESSSINSNYGWLALSGNSWRSASRTFDRDTRKAIEPEGEYIQFDFTLPLSVTGIEFKSGDKNNEFCASAYHVERQNTSGQWEVIPGSVSEVIACSRVNITW